MNFLDIVDATPSGSSSKNYTLHSLIRCERAAIHAYEKTLERYRCESLAFYLNRLNDDHRELLGELESYRNEGISHDIALLGPWNSFEKISSVWACDLDNALLFELKAAEADLIHFYEDALASTQLDSESRKLLRSKLIPWGWDHITELDWLIGLEAA